MTDKERYISLLRDFGIPFTDSKSSDNLTCIDVSQEIVIIEKEDDYDVNVIVDGYGGFYFSFFFDENGIFKKVGVWE